MGAVRPSVAAVPSRCLTPLRLPKKLIDEGLVLEKG